MALKRDIYRELEDILGPENISDDLAVLDAYAFQPMGGAAQGIRYFARPEAVVLPGSTEDVQAVIKLCNRRGIKSKAFGTGYGAHNAVGGEGVIILDLRRMNRILDLDEKNMYIVAEPYVSFAQVQAEAMKVGLCCHVIAAGSQTSFLASHTSMHGNNILSVSHGYSGRNLMGAEWVLPTGEILRIGSLGSGAGWFSGDGPGPSLRGILRGALGAMGGLGVFTKCAGHLHPWPGPKGMEIKGTSPEYEAVIPPLYEYHICEFPSWEQFGEAMSKIGKAGIAYAMHKTGGPGSHGACITSSNNEYYDRRQAGELGIPFVSFSIVQAAHSPGEHEYQVKVLNKILEETDGKFSPIGEELTFKKRDYMTMVQACLIPRLAFRLTGTFGVDGIVAMDTAEHMAAALRWDEGHRNKYAKKGVIMDDGVLNSWAIVFEGSHFALAEAGHQFSSTDDESWKGMLDMVKEGREQCMTAPYNWAWAATGDEVWNMAGPACGNYHHWMRKIKKSLDPSAVSDPSFYISAEQE